jgi:hypothetical protein
MKRAGSGSVTSDTDPRIRIHNIGTNTTVCTVAADPDPPSICLLSQARIRIQNPAQDPSVKILATKRSKITKKGWRLYFEGVSRSITVHFETHNLSFPPQRTVLYLSTGTRSQTTGTVFCLKKNSFL